MKKHILVLAGMVMILFTLTTPSLLPAEEGHMEGMKGHDMKGMQKTDEQVVTDPVCGMEITPETATGGKVEYEGKTYYFCGDSDREAFEKDPARYINKMEKNSHHDMEMKHDGSHGKEDRHGEHHEMEMEEHKSEGHEHHHMMGGAHWMAPAEEAAKANPVEATEASITKGKAIFQEHCMICHGKEGKGTGALAGSLDPKPADLTGRMIRMHPDGDIFYKISKGRGAMPSWEMTIPEEDRWNLVNYIRSLSKDQ